MPDYFTLEVLTDLQHEHLVSNQLDIHIEQPYSFESPFKEYPGFNCRFNIFLEDQETVDQVKPEIESLLNNTDIPFHINLHQNMHTDWQNEWKKFFTPIHINNRISVLPAWENTATPTTHPAIYIDPGMAFGTGSHATTRGCLTLMTELDFNMKTVLDFGTGSGILAIGACLLGATRVIAVDNDQVAIDSALQNSTTNHCDHRIAFYSGDSISSLPHESYNIVLANITTDVIMAHFDHLVAKQPQLEYVILSGIIDHRKDELLDFLTRRRIRPDKIFSDSEWHTFLIKY